MKQPKCEINKIYTEIRRPRERETARDSERERERAMCTKAVCNVVAMKRNGMEWSDR